MELREASVTVQGKGLTDEISNPRLPQEYEICWASPNAVVSVAGDHAQISICSARRPGLLLAVAHALEKHNLAVVSQHVSSDQFKDIILTHVQVNAWQTLFSPFIWCPNLEGRFKFFFFAIIEQAGRASGQLRKTQTAKEVFKSAVDEIIKWIS